MYFTSILNDVKFVFVVSCLSVKLDQSKLSNYHVIDIKPIKTVNCLSADCQPTVCQLTVGRRSIVICFSFCVDSFSIGLKLGMPFVLVANVITLVGVKLALTCTNLLKMEIPFALLPSRLRLDDKEQRESQFCVD